LINHLVIANLTRFNIDHMVVLAISGFNNFSKHTNTNVKNINFAITLKNMVGYLQVQCKYHENYLKIKRFLRSKMLVGKSFTLARDRNKRATSS